MTISMTTVMTTTRMCQKTTCCDMTTSLTTTIDNADLSITTPSTIQVHTAYTAKFKNSNSN